MDCTIGGWSDWQQCVRGEITNRSQIVAYPALNGGSPCPALATEYRACVQDCVVSNWTWANCTYSAPTGHCNQTGTRSILISPYNGGVACPSLTTNQFCSYDGCPKINCTVSDWIWGNCTYDVSSGHCNQTGTRVILGQPMNGGAACPSLTTNQFCSYDGCPKINCSVSDWTWSNCTNVCGSCSQTGTRSVIIQPVNGGSACPSLTTSRTSANSEFANGKLIISDFVMFIKFFVLIPSCSFRCLQLLLLLRWILIVVPPATCS